MRPNPKVTFEEFEVWWKEQEADSLIGDMDAADVAEVSWHHHYARVLSWRDRRARLLSWHNSLRVVNPVTV
jgi:hypothetical protein